MNFNSGAPMIVKIMTGLSPCLLALTAVVY
jgi:hypothetical protein